MQTRMTLLQKHQAGRAVPAHEYPLWQLGKVLQQGNLFSIFGRCFPCLSLEELGHCGQIREMKIFCNLRNGIDRVFQLFYNGSDQCGTDMVVGRFLRSAFYDPVQILRRYTQLQGIPDSMFFTYMCQQKPYKLFEQDVLTAGLCKFPIFIFLTDMLVCHIHHEYPKRTLQHFCLEMMGIVLKNFYDTVIPLQKELHSFRRQDENRPYLYFHHIRRVKVELLFQKYLN